MERWRQPEKTSPWQRISVGMWDSPGDPQTYGAETHPVETLLNYLEEYPDLNSSQIDNKAYQRTSNNILCLVATDADSPGQAVPDGVKQTDLDPLDMTGIAGILKDRARTLRSADDLEIEKTRQLFEYLPS